MRSGLQKPGFILFLALIVLLLLSLVLSFTKESSLNFGYISSSRVSNGLIGVRSCLRDNTGYCESSSEGFTQPCYGRTSSFPQPAANGPSRSSSEVASSPEHEHMAYPATEIPSVIQRASAFKTFVPERLDGRQGFEPFFPRAPPRAFDTVSTSHSPALINSTTTFPLLSDDARSLKSYINSNAVSIVTSDIDPPVYSLFSRFGELRQQVCHFENISFKKRAPRYILHHITLIFQSYLTNFIPGNKQPYSKDPSAEDQPHQSNPRTVPSLYNSSSDIHGDLSSSLECPLPLSIPARFSPLPATVARQSKVAEIGQNSKHMGGSSMAIVIGLVAGVIWF